MKLMSCASRGRHTLQRLRRAVNVFAVPEDIERVYPGTVQSARHRTRAAGLASLLRKIADEYRDGCAQASALPVIRGAEPFSA